MKDHRITSLRRALEGLVESLDATARLSRWRDTEDAPQPLRESAAKLGERLEAANQLAAGKIAGGSSAVPLLTGMSSAIQRLDAAYVQYRDRIDANPDAEDEAAVALDAEIGTVKSEAEQWA
jgi:hypothetical protein